MRWGGSMKFIFMMLLLPIGVMAESSFTVELSKAKAIQITYEDYEEGRPTLLYFNITGNSKLERQDKEEVRKLLSSKNLAPSERRILTMIDEMFPTGESVGEYQSFFSEFKAASFEQICHLRGKKHHGFYSVGKVTYRGEATVGDPNSRCYGRCGPSCGILLYREVYTQECFEHDLCNRREGTQLGVCEDEFWRAADGYLSAWSC